MAAKVIPLGNVTRLDLPVDRILDAEPARALTGVVLLGWDENDELYCASSMADGGEVMWLLEMAKQQLLRIAEEMD